MASAWRRAAADAESGARPSFGGSPVRTIHIDFESVPSCPLCGAAGVERAVLRRRWYSFGPFRIGIPKEGVPLLACQRCNLLFKAVVPEPGGFARIMAAAAGAVWRPKKGPHPAVPAIERHLPHGPVDILDIGASNGDLLVQLSRRGGRLSALDVGRFSRCAEIVTGEYIIGEIDQPLTWSGHRYGLVTAFDVFEHVRDAREAADNVMRLAAPGGLVIVETGDWTTASAALASWYYVNLFEHHVFWSRHTFDYVCGTQPCRLEAYEVVEHKGRRALSATKRAILRAVTTTAGVPGCARLVQAVTGRDPTLLGQPGRRDHAFVVLRRSTDDRSDVGGDGKAVSKPGDQDRPCR